MAQEYSGGISVATGFKLNDPQPIDDRLVVASLSDLYSNTTLPNVYAGIVVAVASESYALYRWNGTDRTQSSNWIEVGSGGSGTEGSQGIQGTQGIQGIQGITGIGQEGPQGIQGSDGPQGIQGPEGGAGVATFNTGSFNSPTLRLTRTDTTYQEFDLSALQSGGSGGSVVAFTPATESDTTYAVGTLAYDDNKIYIRTSSGWKQAYLYNLTSSTSPGGGSGASLGTLQWAATWVYEGTGTSSISGDTSNFSSSTNSITVTVLDKEGDSQLTNLNTLQVADKLRLTDGSNESIYQVEGFGNTSVKQFPYLTSVYTVATVNIASNTLPTLSNKRTFAGVEKLNSVYAFVSRLGQADGSASLSPRYYEFKLPPAMYPNSSGAYNPSTVKPIPTSATSLYNKEIIASTGIPDTTYVLLVAGVNPTDSSGQTVMTQWKLVLFDVESSQELASTSFTGINDNTPWDISLSQEIINQVEIIYSESTNKVFVTGPSNNIPEFTLDLDNTSISAATNRTFTKPAVTNVNASKVYWQGVAYDSVRNKLYRGLRYYNPGNPGGAYHIVELVINTNTQTTITLRSGEASLYGVGGVDYSPSADALYVVTMYDNVSSHSRIHKLSSSDNTEDISYINSTNYISSSVVGTNLVKCNERQGAVVVVTTNKISVYSQDLSQTIVPVVAGPDYFNVGKIAISPLHGSIIFSNESSSGNHYGVTTRTTMFNLEQSTSLAQMYNITHIASSNLFIALRQNGPAALLANGNLSSATSKSPMPNTVSEDMFGSTRVTYFKDIPSLGAVFAQFADGRLTLFNPANGTSSYDDFSGYPNSGVVATYVFSEQKYYEFHSDGSAYSSTFTTGSSWYPLRSRNSTALDTMVDAQTGLKYNGNAIYDSNTNRIYINRLVSSNGSTYPSIHVFDCNTEQFTVTWDYSASSFNTSIIYQIYYSEVTGTIFATIGTPSPDPSVTSGTAIIEINTSNGAITTITEGPAENPLYFDIVGDGNFLVTREYGNTLVLPISIYLPTKEVVSQVGQPSTRGSVENPTTGDVMIIDGSYTRLLSKAYTLQEGNWVLDVTYDSGNNITWNPSSDTDITVEVYR